jgi:hypothetical protein
MVWSGMGRVCSSMSKKTTEISVPHNSPTESGALDFVFQQRSSWRPKLARPLPLPRRRAGGTAGGGAWAPGWAPQAVEKAV